MEHPPRERLDIDALANYLTAHSPYTPPATGRITRTTP